MAQHDYIIANQSGAAFRSDLNNGLAAIVSQQQRRSTTQHYLRLPVVARYHHGFVEAQKCCEQCLDHHWHAC
jgi:hypothetical protein